MRYIKTKAGRIAIWERKGEKDAPQLVLIHGNSASKAAFADLFTAPALGSVRMMAIDMPGSGESDDAHDPPASYTIPALAGLIIQVISKLRLHKPVVLGWSLGGHIAIEALGQGLPLSGLILTGTPPSGPGPEEVLTTFILSESDVAFTENPSPEALDDYVHRLYGNSCPIPGAFFAAAHRCDGRLRRLFAEHWLSASSGFHQRSVTRAWPRPIAVIQGDEEPFFDPKLLDGLPWGNLWRGAGQWVSGTGHAPFFERPAAYADLVAAFLHDIAEGKT